MHKTVQKTCYTKVFYVTAFGFVGCILFFEGFGAFHFFHKCEGHHKTPMVELLIPKCCSCVVNYDHGIFCSKRMVGFRIYTWWIVRFCDRGSPFWEWHIVWNVYSWYTLFSLCFLGHTWVSMAENLLWKQVPSSSTGHSRHRRIASWKLGHHDVCQPFVAGQQGLGMKHPGAMKLSANFRLTPHFFLRMCWWKFHVYYIVGSWLLRLFFLMHFCWLEFHGCWQIVDLNYRWW